MTESNQTCQNCGAGLIGDYCHACGQRGDEPRRVVIGLVQDFLVDTLAIDGKLARTIFLLLTRPGRLARRYLDGQRVRYSPPFRLYLFTSVFFFFALFWSFDVKPGDNQAPAAVEEQLEVLEGVDPQAAEDTREAIEENGEQTPFTESNWEDADYNGPAWLEPYVQQLYEAGQQVVDDPRLFLAEVKENLPRVLLLAPIAYALILLLLYFYRRKFFVYDHFVVSLYMHAALYAYLLLGLLISKLPVVGWLAAAPVAWGLLQPLAVFRQAYGSNWISVIGKWLISNTIYWTLLTVIITFGLSYSLYQSGGEGGGDRSLKPPAPESKRPAERRAFFVRSVAPPPCISARNGRRGAHSRCESRNRKRDGDRHRNNGDNDIKHGGGSIAVSGEVVSRG